MTTGNSKVSNALTVTIPVEVKLRRVVQGALAQRETWRLFKGPDL